MDNKDSVGKDKMKVKCKEKRCVVDIFRKDGACDTLWLHDRAAHT